MSKKIIIGLLGILISVSCTKVDVTFGNEGTEGDPNISYFDNYTVELATYKIDSFATSSDSVFTIGYHIDSAFGTISAGSFSEINLPAENPVKDQNVSFDSLVVILKPNGSYYGDTLTPFRINVHRLLENIENEDAEETNFYNPRSFQFDPVSLGQITSVIRPKRGKEITIRLSDVFGKDLLMKFKENDDVIREQDDFLDYFKGLYLGTDSSFTKAMYYFNSDSSGMIMRMHYKLRGATSEEKYFDFTFNSNKQYNQIKYNHAATDLAAFTPFKKQLKKSSLTGHRAFLHNNMGSYIKISFPNILNLKELHPYIKILSAELVIKPSPATYRYPYMLPSSLRLITTDENNYLRNPITDASGQELTGNLHIDNLYGETTQYSYDITNFITNLINEGRFTNTALMLSPASGMSAGQLERLVISDQTLNKNIQLKLYVLGL